MQYLTTCALKAAAAIHRFFQQNRFSEDKFRNGLGVEQLDVGRHGAGAATAIPGLNINNNNNFQITKRIFVPALGTTKICCIMSCHRHTAVTLAALVTRHVVHHHVLQVLINTNIVITQQTNFKKRWTLRIRDRQ